MKQGAGATRHLRRRPTLRGELLLAALPTVTVLLDPQHGTNSVRTLTLAQMLAATLGLVTFVLIGPGYLSGAVAMACLIVLMIVLDVAHPPAVSTALSFALRAGPESIIDIFGLAVGVTAVLTLLERAMLWLLARYPRQFQGPSTGPADSE